MGTKETHTTSKETKLRRAQEFHERQRRKGGSKAKNMNRENLAEKNKKQGWVG